MAESARDIKRRIKSVKNIAQITKAMEAVSANKMRKSQQFAINARPYAIASFDMLHNLLSRVKELPPILKRQPLSKSALLVVTSDKGLAAAYNSNVLRVTEKLIAEKKKDGKDYILITVGKKAKDYFARRKEPIAKSFYGFGDFSELMETKPVVVEIIDGFLSGRWHGVKAIYTHFRTTLKQEVVTRRILPASEEGIKEIVLGILPEYGKYAPASGQHSIEKVGHSKYSLEYLLEPSAEKILTALVPKLLHMHIHHIILESNASEHSSRMVAMKNASDNAKELIGDLSLVYNKVRQAGITREIIEITAGSEALKN